MEYCIICGSPISDSNLTGIGCECRAALCRAKSKLFFSKDENKLKYNWTIQASILREAFLVKHEGINFRSAFRKNFFKSITENARISKKQLAIIIDMLRERMTADEFREIFKRIEDERDFFYRSECEKYEITREAIEIARREVRAKRTR